MTTLDQTIEIHATGFNAPASGLYPYTLNKGGETIFSGQVYLNQGDDEIDIDVTDIVKNYTYDAKKWYGFNYDSSTLGSSTMEVITKGLIDSVNISIKVGQSSWYSGVAQTVGSFYRNPAHAQYDFPCSNWQLPSSESAFYPLNEGIERETSSGSVGSWNPGDMLISHYPFQSTNNYGISMIYNTGNSTIMHIGFGERLTSSTGAKNWGFASKKMYGLWIGLNHLFTNVFDNGNGKVGRLTLNNERFAIVDMCPAPYYIKWQSRYGSFNSYGLFGKRLQKNDYTKELTTNYRGYTKPISTKVTQTWNVSTGWIPEADVKHFESLFVSPYIALYDSRQYTTYSVIMKDNTFEEKTYKSNGKKMVSLSFNLELDKQELILT